MAFLLRLRSIRTLKTPSPSLSLLHHHHRHLSSTSNSNSGSGDHPNTNNPFPSSLYNSNPTSSTFNSKQLMPNPSPSLLHHHRHLSSTSNSGDSNSASLVRELSEAIKQLSVVEYIFETPFTNILSSLPSFTSNPVTYSFSTPSCFDSNSKQPQQEANFDVDAAATKLEQLKASALTLKKRQLADRQRLWDMIESHKSVMEEMRQKEERKGSFTGEKPETMDGLILEMKRVVEMALEVVHLSHELTKSRIASLCEIVENLSQMRKYLGHDVWNELNEGLKRGMEMEVKDFELLAEETNLKLIYFKQRVVNLTEMRDNWERERERSAGLSH